MQFKLRTRRLSLTRVARIVVAIALTCALLSGFAPRGLTSAVHLCRMACCAGRAPHEAGSCQHGGCHAVLPVRKASPPVKPQTEACGAQMATAHHDDMHMQHDVTPMREAATPPAGTSSTATHAHEHQNDSSSKQSTPESAPPDAAVVRAFVKPCPPECGAGTCSGSTQSRPRDDAALAHADKPCPPSCLSHAQPSDNLQTTLDALSRRSRPRGPPSFFS